MDYAADGWCLEGETGGQRREGGRDREGDYRGEKGQDRGRGQDKGEEARGRQRQSVCVLFYLWRYHRHRRRPRTARVGVAEIRHVRDRQGLHRPASVRSGSKPPPPKMPVRPGDVHSGSGAATTSASFSIGPSIWGASFCARREHRRALPFVENGFEGHSRQSLPRCPGRRCRLVSP